MLKNMFSELQKHRQTTGIFFKPYPRISLIVVGSGLPVEALAKGAFGPDGPDRLPGTEPDARANVSVS